MRDKTPKKQVQRHYNKLLSLYSMHSLDLPHDGAFLPRNKRHTLTANQIFPERAGTGTFLPGKGELISGVPHVFNKRLVRAARQEEEGGKQSNYRKPKKARGPMVIVEFVVMIIFLFQRASDIMMEH